MRNFLRLFYSGEGQGNIGYDFPPANAAGILNAANDGLSTDAATSKIAQLGQTLARVGDPAKLLEDREIPSNGHQLAIGHLAAGQNVIAFEDTLGIAAFNKLGNGYQVQWQIGADASSINIRSNGGSGLGTGDVVIDTNTDEYRYAGDLAEPVYTWTRPGIPTGFGCPIRIQTTTPSNLDVLDYTVLMDATAGNLVIDIDPTKFSQRIVNIKKIDSTVNTVTLTMLSGLIFDIGAGVASFVLGTQGESVQLHCDGINMYVI